MGNDQDNVVKLFRDGGWLDQLDAYIGQQIAFTRGRIRLDLVLAHVYGFVIGLLVAALCIAYEHPEILQRH